MKSILIGLVALAALHSAAVAQVKPGIEIRGVVVSAADGKPAEGVKVTPARRTPSGQEILNESAMTDARGAFTLRVPSVGEYSLEAYRQPFAFGMYPGDPFTSANGRKWFTVAGATAGIVIKLYENPKVAGTVRDQNDQPIANAIVRTLQEVVLGGREVLKTTGRAVSDPVGAYSLQVFVPGKYILAAVPSNAPGSPVGPPQFYPGVTTATAATPLDLAPGRIEQPTDFRLPREPGVTVAGILNMPFNLPGLNQVSLYDLSSNELPSDLEVATVQAKDGRFAFSKVRPGSYEIRYVRYPQSSPEERRNGPARFTEQHVPVGRMAFLSGEATWWAAARIQVSDRDLSLSIDVSQGLHVKGRVIFDGSAEKPDPSELTTRGVYLRSVDYRFFAPVPLGAPREDGSFSTIGVPAGRYVLGMLDSYKGFQLQSVTVAGREVAGMSFELGRDITDAVLTFSDRATTVTGQITGVKDQERSVILWPEDEALWGASGTELGRIYRAVTTDGLYTIRVFPGRYRAAAIAGVPPRDWESSRYLRSLFRSSQRMEVGAGQRVVFNASVPAR